jgi:glucose/arabinose dehydrogenase
MRAATRLAFALVLIAACSGGAGTNNGAPTGSGTADGIVDGTADGMRDDATGKALPSSDADPALDTSALSLVNIGALDQPVDAASRIGDDAIYFVARGGTVHRFVDGTFDSTPVLDITDLTVGEGERGLLGLAFSGDGTTAYLNYTNLAGDTTVASIAARSDGVFDRATMTTLLVIEQPFHNHNAGDVVVEPSGTLLVPMGDGGSANDPLRVSLDDSSLLGKVVRLDPRDGSTTVLAKGLRNPWRVDLFDDRLWLADVGQSEWEEVSVLDGVSSATAPIDFGWSAYEANERFNQDQSSPRHVPPVFAYRHGDDGCSVSGGAVATRGALRNRYVFADYCSGRLWSIATDDAKPSVSLHFNALNSPSAVVRAADDIFVLSLSGTIWRLRG